MKALEAPAQPLCVQDVCPSSNPECRGRSGRVDRFDIVWEVPMDQSGQGGSWRNPIDWLQCRKQWPD